jgi:hypothetical protein
MPSLGAVCGRSRRTAMDSVRQLQCLISMIRSVYKGKPSLPPLPESVDVAVVSMLVLAVWLAFGRVRQAESC